MFTPYRDMRKIFLIAGLLTAAPVAAGHGQGLLGAADDVAALKTDAAPRQLTVAYETLSERISIASAAAAEASIGRLEATLPLRRLSLFTEGRPINVAAAGRGATTIARYRARYDGIPLALGSDVTVIVGPGGNATVRTRHMPQSVDGTTPEIDRQAGIDTARQRFGAARRGERVTVSEPNLEFWVDGGRRGRLAWAFTVRTTSIVRPRAVRYWVAARDRGEILDARDEIHSAPSGSVSALVWNESPRRPAVKRPLPNLTIKRGTAKSASDLVTTDRKGRFTFYDPGSNDVRLTPAGPFAVVRNQLGPDLEKRFTLGPGDGNLIRIEAQDEQNLAQATAFYWTTRAQRFVRRYLPKVVLRRLPTRVNIDSSCNAYWDGRSINFFRASDPGDKIVCPNTAYSSIVVHELGHGVDHYLGGIVGGGYSEGFGDALAQLVLRSPCMAADLLQTGQCGRNGAKKQPWTKVPEICDRYGEIEVHCAGETYAGFTWELIQQLLRFYGDPDAAYREAARMILGAAAANPASIPDAVRLSFLVDDRDGDLRNGTTHYAQLAAAAEALALPYPRKLKSQPALKPVPKPELRRRLKPRARPRAPAPIPKRECSASDILRDAPGC